MKQISPSLIKYIKKYKLNKLINYYDFTKKEYDLFDTVNINYNSPFYPDWYDLVQLHKTIVKNKIINVLEFGVGYSTIIMADALRINEQNYKEYVIKNFRKNEPFKIYSVDSDKKFIKSNLKKLKKLNLDKYCHISFSETYLSTFNGRICSYYKKLPNVLPDLIYLDAPGLFDVKGTMNGIHFRSMERFPISADLLQLEYMLLPGCRIIIDGRKTNGRFLINNFQRNWKYIENDKYDYCELYLDERPIGNINKKQLKFSR